MKNLTLLILPLILNSCMYFPQKSQSSTDSKVQALPKITKSSKIQSNESLQVDLFNAINDLRINKGLKPVKFSNLAARMSYQHCAEMARQTGRSTQLFTSHDNFKNRAQILTHSGAYKIGENVAGINKSLTKEPVKNLLKGWLSSPKHQENVLNPQWTHSGTGVFKTSQGVIYATQIFLKK